MDVVNVPSSLSAASPGLTCACSDRFVTFLSSPALFALRLRSALSARVEDFLRLGLADLGVDRVLGSSVFFSCAFEA